MKRGYIYWSKDTTHNPHPIVCLKDCEEETFEGAIISHDDIAGNVAMKSEHFKQTDEEGNAYSIVYGPSFLVKEKYEKISIGTNEKPKGALSDEGISFIENELLGHEPRFSQKPVWKDRDRIK